MCPNSSCNLQKVSGFILRANNGYSFDVPSLSTWKRQKLYFGADQVRMMHRGLEEEVALCCLKGGG